MASDDIGQCVLFHNARVVDVIRHRTYRGWFVTSEGRLRLVEEGSSTPPEYDTSVDLLGGVVAPALVDAHTHIESSFVTPRRYAEAVIPHGTTTILADPHEIANVLGVDGIRFMLDASSKIPLTVYISLPSCVPSASYDIETVGAVLTASDLKEFVGDPRVIALGEVMNCKGVLTGDARILDVLRMARKEGLFIEGHAPVLSGQMLSKYLSHGIETDHTLTNPDKILEQLSKGVWVELQEKSITPENVDTLNRLPDLSRVLLVTDDIVGSRIMRGHLLSNVRKAVTLGLNPYEALSSATWRPAMALGLRDTGIIAPGFRADFIVFDDCDDWSVRAVYKGGTKVARDGEALWNRDYPSADGKGWDDSSSAASLPQWVRNTVRRDALKPDDFCVPLSDGIHTVYVIEANRFNTATELGTLTVAVRDGVAEVPPDVALAFVFERHGKGGGRGFAFVRGYGLSKGACATTVAHDAHNLLVLGKEPSSMVSAANAVISSGGGLAIARGQSVTHHVPLPIAGLMSDEPLLDISFALERLEKELKQLGVVHTNPLLFLVMLTLAVSPKYKVTDEGLVDVERQAIMPLVVV